MKRRNIAGFLASCLLIGLMTSCEQTAEQIIQEDGKQTAGKYTELTESDGIDCELEGMREVFSNNQYRLCLNFSTTDFAVIEKSTGQVRHSNPQNADKKLVIGENIRSKLISNLAIQYNDKVFKEYTYSTLDDSVAYRQFKFYKLDNGIRIVYTLGKDESKELIPPVLDTKAFDKILKALEPKDQKNLKSWYTFYQSSVITDGIPVKAYDKAALLKEYPALAKKDLYVVRNMNAYQKKQLKGFLEKANFSYKDMVEQIQASGFEYEVDSVIFTIPLDITVDDKGFSAEVDLSLVSQPKGYSIYKIALLCGMGGTADTGTFVVPDGSGALMDMYHQKNSVYSQRIYGEDLALISKTDVNTVQAILPFYAMLSKNQALLASIESGTAMSNVVALQRGATNPVSTAYAEFIVTDKDYKKSKTLTSTFSPILVGSGQPQGKIKVYYIFMNGESSYADAAVRYRQHLTEKGSINRKTRKEIPYILELYGLIDKEKSVLGLPVTVKESLTTFTQAEKILAELKGKSVGNIQVRYLGLANGGMVNSMTDSLEISRQLGGNKGFKNLLAYADKNKIEIFPDAVMNYVYRDHVFDGFSASRDTSRQLDSKLSGISHISLTNGEATEMLKRYLVAPGKVLVNTKTLLEDLSKKGIRSLSFSTLGKTIYSNFDKKSYTTRADALELYQQAFQALDQKNIRMMIDTGNLYALRYTDTVVNLPAGGREYDYQKQNIPFVQMVLYGSVDYAMTSFNKTSNSRWELLRAIETGGTVYYCFMYEENTILKRTDFENLFSLHYKNWLAQSVEMYQVLSKALKPVKNALMTDHTSITSKVFATKYDNGVVIYVNYSNDDYLVDGITVPANGYATGGVVGK